MHWYTSCLSMLLYTHVQSMYMKGGQISAKDKHLTNALRDILAALPAHHIGIAFDFKADALLTHLSQFLFKSNIMMVSYMSKEHHSGNKSAAVFRLIDDVKGRIASYRDGVYIIFVKSARFESIIQEIYNENLIRRNILYIFYWGQSARSVGSYKHLYEALRICIITNPRPETYKVYCNQGSPSGRKELELVNWWSLKGGLFRSPTAPPIEKIYQDFNGRLFNIPVLHKPPWNFVIRHNDSIEVKGGRDVELLALLSSKLNFRYEYFDQPDRSQGSSIVNGSMKGVLGQIWKREVDFFIGDVTVTKDRSLSVEFSFFTLADSEAFLTHSPGKISEALALIHPFQWQVWPPVIALMVICGPLLYIFIWIFEVPQSFRRRKKIDKRLLCDCIWLSTSIFLRQSSTLRLKIKRVRILVSLLYLFSTYVIGDMYSANLTSILAKPAKEKPINTLEELQDAIKYNNYQLMVERQSASHAILQNGTGISRNLWSLMKRQQKYLVGSVEEGMLLVKSKRNYVFIGGRETLIYDIRRFGLQYFHLSDKLHTRYSAIALQIGCPFIHSFNKILMRIFEAGILNKITEDEYQKLGEEPLAIKEKKTNIATEGSEARNDYSTTKSMNMKTLQGAFFVLICGYIIAGSIFITENINLGESTFMKKNKSRESK